jgi:hypothetical protein
MTLAEKFAGGAAVSCLTVGILAARPITGAVTRDTRGGVADFAVAELANPADGIGPPYTLLLSDGDFCGRPDDLVAPNICALPRMLNPGSLDERTPYGAESIGRLATSNSTVILANADQYWDVWLGSNSSVGLTLELWLVEEGGRIDQGIKITSFVIGSMYPDGDSCVIEPQASVDPLEIPALSRFFTGEGGAEGDADLEGIRRERTLGFARSVPCELVDAANLDYAVSDAAISDVTVLEDGEPRILWDGVDHMSEETYRNPANDPDPGFFTKYTKGGRFRLGTSPASGSILTADVEGNLTVDGGFEQTPGSLLTDFVVQTLGWGRINTDTFDLLPNGRVVGVHIPRGSTLTVAEIFSSVLRPFAAHYYIDDKQKVSIALSVAPGASGSSPAFDFDRDQLLDEGASGVIQPARWRIGVTYERNYTVLANTQVSTNLTQAEQNARTREESFAFGVDETVIEKYRNAAPVDPEETDRLDIRGYFKGITNAQATANALLEFHRAPLERIRATVRLRDGLAARRGATGRIAGRDVTVERWSADLAQQTVTIEAVAFARTVDL